MGFLATFVVLVYIYARCSDIIEKTEASVFYYIAKYTSVIAAGLIFVVTVAKLFTGGGA
jgi:hypothetical protein